MGLITVLLIIVICIINATKFLFMVLLVNGYNPLTYAVYGKFDDENQVIIKVEDFDKKANYVGVIKNAENRWSILDYGVKDSINIMSRGIQSSSNYISLNWSEPVLIVTDENSMLRMNEYKLIEIEKVNNDINFDLAQLPEEVNHTIKETDNSYIVELCSYATEDKYAVPVSKIQVEDIISNDLEN